VRVYQFRHLGVRAIIARFKPVKNYLLFAALEFAPAFVRLTFVFEAAALTFAGLLSVAAVFVFVRFCCGSMTGDCVFVFAAGADELSPTVCKTEIFPVIAGIASSRAEIKKVAAAAMVIFDKIVCVPRGPKAELEILLVNKAPASVLPGCKSTVAINTMQEIKNSA
jgi:hypothetical protein